MADGIDVYTLGSEKPFGQVVFTEEQTINPAPDSSAGALPKEGVRRHVRDTYFANIFRKYMAQGRYDHDAEMLNNFRDLITTHLERTVSIGMVRSDLQQSITETGITIESDERLFETAQKLLETRFIDDAISMFGLSGFRDEIMLREIDVTFGTATQLAAERRQQQRKAQEREDWYHTTFAGVHNMMRELVTATKAAAGIPEPASIFRRRQQAPSQFVPRQQEQRSQRTQDTEDTEASVDE